MCLGRGRGKEEGDRSAPYSTEKTQKTLPENLQQHKDLNLDGLLFRLISQSFPHSHSRRLLCCHLYT